jgi:hypothetical protein
MGQKRNPYVLAEKPDGINNLKNTGVRVRIILK